MTKVLKLSLLGPVELAFDDDRVIVDLVSAKAQALFCYLAVNGRAHSRQALAGLLWGDLPEEDARRNLRGVLMKLRQRFDPYLLISHQTIAFNRHAAYWLDVEQFQSGADARNLAHLRECATLYRGEFLEELFVRQAPDFEAWLQHQRAQMHQQAIAIHTLLVNALRAEGQWEEGMEMARRLVRLDTTREFSQQLLMRLLAQSGQRAAALAHFEQYRAQLQAELSVDVSPETAALAEQIRSGAFSAVQASDVPVTKDKGQRTKDNSLQPQVAPPIFSAGPPISHPARFFGREREVRRLFNLLRQRPLQNAAIIGPRRSGKTSLLHYLKSVTTTPPAQLRPAQEQQWLPDPAAYRWVFVDFQDARLGHSQGLLRYMLAEMGLPAPASCRLDTFLDIVSEQLRAPTVILFDEIDVALARYPELDDAFWDSLRSLATNQVEGNLAYILSSHEAPEVLAQHRGLGSPFFNIFGYTAVLGPLSEAAARELITSAPLPIPEGDVDWLLAASGCWPMPLQILCRERLLALEEGDTGDDWRRDGQRQAAPFLLNR